MQKRIVCGMLSLCLLLFCVHAVQASPRWKREWRAGWLRHWRLEHTDRHAMPNAVAPAAKKTAASQPAAAPAPAAVIGSVKQQGAAALQSGNSIFGQTRPDAFSHGGAEPISSPAAALAQGWKMLAYLLPTLLLIMGALHLLKKVQQRTGFLPVNAAVPPSAKRPAGGLLARLRPADAARPVQQGTHIRLVESTPLGGSNLALVEVRGKLLLLGVSGGSVALISEFSQQGMSSDNDFRALMQAAAADMDGMDFSASGLLPSALAGGLDEAVQEASLALTRTMRRLRTVNEVEEEL